MIATHTAETFFNFVQNSDVNYQNELACIPLFHQQKTSQWNKEQKKYFASIFYHLRGHFINFSWYVANFSTDEETKKIILKNLEDELGLGSRFSHELLYERFANECDVSIHDEIVNETHYLPFAKAFNKSHIQWLSLHDNQERLAAFAAYERLDNLDYPRLVEFGNSLNLSQQAMTFFKIHVHVEHFESSVDLLLPIWEQNPEKIKKAFHFIYEHQLNMWRDLSKSVFELNPTQH